MPESLIFVDTNIPIYAMGAAHPHKEPCIRWFRGLAEGRYQAVTDAEVLQEILYRHWRIQALPHGFKVFDQVVELLATVYPVTRQDAERARQLLQEFPELEPRDLLHAAIMLNRNVSAILSYDRHFDRIRDVRRIEP